MLYVQHMTIFKSKTINDNMRHSTKTVWKSNMAFDGKVDGHTIHIDAQPPLGDGTGPGPKKLLLISLAGCTGMDVVSLLKKMRVPFTGLEIGVDADLTEEHPKVYSEIRITYRVFGTDLDKEKVQKAVGLSQERYCGVSAMLRENSPLTYTVGYVDQDIKA